MAKKITTFLLLLALFVSSFTLAPFAQAEEAGSYQIDASALILPKENVKIDSWTITGAQVKEYTVEMTGPESRDPVYNIVLEHGTAWDTELKIYFESTTKPVIARINAALDSMVKDSVALKKLGGLSATLEDGTASGVLYATVSGSLPEGTERYILTCTFNFSIAGPDTSNDPIPDNVQSIAITTPPTQTEYFDGRRFNPAGMAVTATLTDGTQASVAGYSVYPSGPLTKDNTQVTVSYAGCEATQAITVIPGAEILDLSIENGQLLSDQKWIFSNTPTETKVNDFEAVIQYGEDKGKITFAVDEGAKVYAGDVEQTAIDGRYTLELDTSVDGTATVVTVEAGEHKRTYTFTCYTQKYDGMPSRVSDYLCMASQYTNASGLGPYGYNAVATLRGVNTHNTTTNTELTGPVSLGNFGGYIVYEYDTPITDNPNNPYGVDFIVYGNSVDGGSGFAEPGQVYVSEDGETWYALAGALHYDDIATWNHSITYQNVNGREPVTGYNYPSSKYYPLFAWNEENQKELTLSGVLLKPQEELNIYGNILPPYAHFGYADVGDVADSSGSNSAGNPYAGLSEVADGVFRVNRTDGFDLKWAVDENGLPVTLENGVKYIKVQTATYIDNGGIGEKSTEVHMMRIAQAAESAVGVTAAPAGISIDGAQLELTEGEYVYEASVSGAFEVKVDAGTDTNVYINSERATAFNFAEIPSHGMIRVIVQEGQKEPLIYYVKLTEDPEGEEKPYSRILFDSNGGAFEGRGDQKLIRVYDEDTTDKSFPKLRARENYTFVGWSYGQKIYTAYSPDMPREMVLTAVWEYSGSPSDPAKDVTVSFRLIGCKQATADIDLATGRYNGAEYVTWIATKTYTMPEGSTVKDLLELALTQAGLQWRNPSGNYVEAIWAPAVYGGYELAEMTNGRNSGWMYTMDGKHPTAGVAQQKLLDGKEIIFHYVNDYAYEVEDWAELGDAEHSPKGDGTYYNKWLEAADVNPSGGAVADPDEDAAQEVIALIDAIGTVTKDSGGKIQAARTAYDGLTAAQKKLVTNYDKLTAAEKDYAKLTGSLPFTDVSGHWALDAVRYVYENDLMNGVGDGRFNPDGTLNRAMLATILYRLEGGPAVTGRNPYSDVAGGQWYTDAIVWASENGIVNGVGEGKFAPTANITRQQLATMLYRYAQYKQYDTGKAADLSGYTDAASAGEWAVAALRWAVAEGLITGRTATTIVPAGTATRAEAATILQRYLEGLAA